MQFQNLIAILLASVTFAAAAPVEERQLNGALLCPLLGTPLCGVQCQLITQTTGQCAPNGYGPIVLSRVEERMC